MDIKRLAGSNKESLQLWADNPTRQFIEYWKQPNEFLFYKATGSVVSDTDIVAAFI